VGKDIRDVAGLPPEIAEDLARAEQELSIGVERRRYGKPVTVVEGFEGGVDVSALASTLKRKLATGGTVADGRIELQGDHADRLPGVLRAEGFRVA
jgi:translation initiation factor 1